MNNRIPFSFALFIGLSSAALADNYGSPPVYPGNHRKYSGQVVCRIFNGGTTAVNITKRQIFSNANASLPLSTDSCNTALGVNHYCAFNYYTSAGDNLAYSCKIKTAETSTQLHGVIEYSDYNEAVINTLPMSQ